MKYLDIATGKTINVYPWSSNIKKGIVKNHPERYHELIEE